ncbi:MAG: hypothetical protein J6U10_06045 [Lachnospiraceae bacterium]|nr:hypothetical protein [Lachnospiraceae bacterium]MBP5184160.1 hypothetical protein [Lachnospiraceae bacterium]
MLDKKKVRIMTKLSIYEKNAGRYDVKLAKYFRSDYVHYHVLRTLVAVTFGYLLLLFMAAVYKSDYLIAEFVTIDYAALGKKLLIIYIYILAIFAVLSIIGYFIAYNVSRKRLSGYYNLLKKLKKYYRLKEDAEEVGESVVLEELNAEDNGRNR